MAGEGSTAVRCRTRRASGSAYRPPPQPMSSQVSSGPGQRQEPVEDRLVRASRILSEPLRDGCVEVGRVVHLATALHLFAIGSDTRGPRRQGIFWRGSQGVRAMWPWRCHAPSLALPSSARLVLARRRRLHGPDVCWPGV